MAPPILFRPIAADGNFPEWFERDESLRGLFVSWKKVFPDSRLLSLGSSLPVGKGPQKIIEAMKSHHAVAMVDREEFIENAARLGAILSLYPERLGIVDGENNASMYLTKEAIPFSSECFYAGIYVQSDEHADKNPNSLFSKYWILGRSDTANNYMDSRVFKKYAGRSIQSCGLDVANPHVDVIAELSKMKAAGKQKAFIKVRQVKYGVYTIDLSGDDIEAALYDSMEFAAEHLAERPNQFILQDHVQIQYEYRIVVLNCVPVCGAGCIEAFTPLQNEDVFDPKVLQFRDHDAADAVVDRDIVAQYLKLAHQFCSELKVENLALKNYSLDLCLIDGKPAVVELNSFQNLGLYAMDVNTMIRAMVSSN